MPHFPLPAAPFRSDGCSGGLSWSWRLAFGENPPWEGACVEHDFAYWKGGTAADRLAADRKLWQAIRDVGYWKIAALAYAAVRVFGASRFTRRKCWGYGHSRS